MQEIAKQRFQDLKSDLNPDLLGFKNGSSYDVFIAGWTKYWSDIFKPKLSLDPNIVKALIGSESSFNPLVKVRAGKNNMARGLMQVTDETREFLSDEKGELKDHFVNLTDKEALDPNLNICAGIRWLFRKREIVEKKYGKDVSWDRVIYFYKAAQKNPKVMDKFRTYLKRLQKSKRVVK